MLGPILRWTHQSVKTLPRSQRTMLGCLVAGLIASGRAGVAAIDRRLENPCGWSTTSSLRWWPNAWRTAGYCA